MFCLLRKKTSRQSTIIPKHELRGFWGDSLTNTPFGVTSAEVAIICPDKHVLTLTNHAVSNVAVFFCPAVTGCRRHTVDGDRGRVFVIRSFLLRRFFLMKSGHGFNQPCYKDCLKYQYVVVFQTANLLKLKLKGVWYHVISKLMDNNPAKRSWDGHKNPVNNGIKLPYQLVSLPDFFMDVA